MKDLRSTIFWKPNIVTDATGRATVEFVNSDVAGTYRAVVEGLDLKGKLGRQVLQYKVQ